MRRSYKHNVVTAGSDFAENYTVRSSGLNTPIHPLWSYENFKTLNFFELTLKNSPNSPPLPYRAYCRLIPALRLASILLERAKPFLERVIFAPLLLKDQSSVPVLSEWSASQESSKALEDELKDLSLTYRIHPCPDENSKLVPGQKFHGVTSNLGGENGQPAQMFCGIADPTFKIADEEDFDERDVLERQSFLVELAVTLIHELTHAVWLKRYHLYFSEESVCRWGKRDHVVFLEGETLHELGERLEYYLFGGFIRARGQPMQERDGSLGLTLHDYHDPATYPTYPIYILTTATIRSFFEPEAWLNACGKHKPFRLDLLPILWDELPQE